MLAAVVELLVLENTVGHEENGSEKSSPRQMSVLSDSNPVSLHGLVESESMSSTKSFPLQFGSIVVSESGSNKLPVVFECADAILQAHSLFQAMTVQTPMPC